MTWRRNIEIALEYLAILGKSVLIVYGAIFLFVLAVSCHPDVTISVKNGKTIITCPSGSK